MRWVWIFVVTILMGSSAYLWLFKRQDRVATPEKIISQIEGQSVETIDSKPVALEAKKLDAVEIKLEKAKTPLQDKSLTRTEVERSVHGTPSAIMKAAETLGEVAELEAQHPERKTEFMKYYRDCYLSEENISVTRVQCLKRYFKSENTSQENRENILSSLPFHIQRLYRRSEAIK